MSTRHYRAQHHVMFLPPRSRAPACPYPIADPRSHSSTPLPPSTPSSPTAYGPSACPSSSFSPAYQVSPSSSRGSCSQKQGRNGARSRQHSGSQRLVGRTNLWQRVLSQHASVPLLHVTGICHTIADLHTAPGPSQHGRECIVIPSTVLSGISRINNCIVALRAPISQYTTAEIQPHAVVSCRCSMPMLMLLHCRGWAVCLRHMSVCNVRKSDCSD